MAHPSFFQRVAQAALWAVSPDSVMKRRIDAASYRPDRNAFFSTHASEVPVALPRSRAASRNGDMNNAYCRAAHRSLGVDIVGAGIVAASTHPDPATAALINAAWTRFCDACDFDQLTNMGGIQAALVGDMIRDGEGLALLRNGPDGLRIQRLAPDQIDDSKSTSYENGGFIQSGVEFDAAGRRVAYWLFPHNPANQFGANMTSVRVAAEDVIHVFEQNGPGQCRGLPWGVAALKRIGEIDQLEDALLVGSKVAGMYCGAIEDSMGASAPFPIDGTQSGTELTAEIQSGTIINLGAGKKITWSSPAQAQQGVEFLASQVRAIASAYGVPPARIDSDYARANFSSLRSSFAAYAPRLDQIVHIILRPMMLDRIWRRWITSEILRNAIQAPDFESNPDAWLGVEWFPPSPPQADDLKHAQADVLQIQNGLKSRAQAIRERGYSPEALDAERAADAERQAALGLTPAPASDPANDEDEDEDEDEDDSNAA